MRVLLTTLGVACLIAAVVRIDVPPVVWTPGDMTRLALAGVGVLLASLAVLLGRGGRTGGDQTS